MKRGAISNDPGLSGVNRHCPQQGGYSVILLRTQLTYDCHMSVTESKQPKLKTILEAIVFTLLLHGTGHLTRELARHCPRTHSWLMLGQARSQVCPCPGRGVYATIMHFSGSRADACFRQAGQRKGCCHQSFYFVLHRAENEPL